MNTWATIFMIIGVAAVVLAFEGGLVRLANVVERYPNKEDKE